MLTGLGSSLSLKGLFSWQAVTLRSIEKKIYINLRASSRNSAPGKTALGIIFIFIFLHFIMFHGFIILISFPLSEFSYHSSCSLPELPV